MRCIEMKIFKNFTTQAFCCCSIKNFIELIWMRINI